MKFTSELIKKAHELTKEIKREYKEVDYRTQFGICLSYLLSKKEEGLVMKKQYNVYVGDYETKTYDVKEDLKALGFEWSNKGINEERWNFTGNAEEVLKIADELDKIGGLLMGVNPWAEELIFEEWSFGKLVKLGFDKEEVVRVLKRFI